MSSVPEQPAESTGWLGNPNYIVDFDLLPVRVETFFNGQLVAEIISNRLQDLVPLVPQVLDSLNELAPGSVIPIASKLG